MLEHSIDIQLKHPDDSFSLFGSNERHLRLMEQELGVVIHARTEKVQVIGQEEHICRQPRPHFPSWARLSSSLSI